MKENNDLKSEMKNIYKYIKIELASIKKTSNATPSWTINNEGKENEEIEECEAKYKKNNDKLYQERLKLLDNLLKDKSLSIRIILEDKDRLILIKENFEAVFKCFELILEEMLKNCDNLLYFKIAGFIDGNKDVSTASKIEKLLSEKIKEGNACSIYYEGLKCLLFRLDGKTGCEILNMFNNDDQRKKNYIKELLGFIEIFENNQNINDIEMKLQGAILFIILNLIDEKRLVSVLDEVNKNNESIRNIMKILICSVNPNYIYIHN